MASVDMSSGSETESPVEKTTSMLTAEDKMLSGLSRTKSSLAELTEKLLSAATTKELKSIRNEMEELNLLIKTMQESLSLLKEPSVGTTEESTKSVNEVRRIPNLPSNYPTFRRKDKEDNFQDMKLFLEAATTCFRSVGLKQKYYVVKLATMVDRVTSRWIDEELIEDECPRFPWATCKEMLINEFKHTKTRQEATNKLNRFDWNYKQTIQSNARRFMLLMQDASIEDDDVARLDQFHFLLPEALYTPIQIFRLKVERRISAGKRAHKLTVRELSREAALYVRNENEKALFNNTAKQVSNGNGVGQTTANRPTNTLGKPAIAKPTSSTTTAKHLFPKKKENTIHQVKSPIVKKPKCFNCGEEGHIRPNCPKKSNITSDTRMSAIRSARSEVAESASTGNDSELEAEADKLFEEFNRDFRCASLNSEVVAETSKPKDNEDAIDRGIPAGASHLTESDSDTSSKPLLNKSSSRTIIPVTVNGHRVLALADTGSENTLICTKWANNINLTLEPTNRSCRSALAGAPRSKCKGQASVVIKTSFAETEMTIYALNLAEEVPMVLGNDVLPRLGIRLSNLPIDYPGAETNKEISIVDQLRVKPELTSRADDKEVKHWVEELVPILKAAQERKGFCTHPMSIVRINTTGYSKPISVYQYPVPLRQIPVVRRKLQDLLSLGIIKPAPKDCLWNSPWVVAPKKNEKGEKVDIRFCVDYRRLNNIMGAHDQHPLPHIRKDILSHIGGFDWYSKIDLKDGFHQMMIAEEDREKTAFTFEGVQYMYVGAPFGLKHLPSHFQRVMEVILDGLDNVKVYVDDIIIFTKVSLKEHTRVIKSVLDRLERWNIRTRMDKCAFFYKQIQILGHIVDSDGIEPDPTKIESALKWPIPRTNKDIQSFMGLVNFFGEHLPGLAGIARPLNEQRNNKKFRAPRDWTPALESSFSQLKELISNALKLSYPVEGHTFVLATDASHYSCGGILYQEIDGKKRYITVFSKTLSKTEQRYSTMRRELLGLLYGFRKCKYYLWGRHFHVITDHRALIYMLTQKKLNEALLNWYEEIMSYDFSISHAPGNSADILLPDALSRLYPSESDKASVKDDDVVPPTRLAALTTINDEVQRHELLDHAHLQGHFGSKALERHIKALGHTWENLRKDCERHVAGCTPCRKYNIQRAGFHPARSVDAFLPMDAVAIDCATLDTASRNKVIVLIVVDLFTHFVWIKSLPDKKKDTVGQALLEIFSNFGLPKIVQSDQGKEFVNTTMKAFMAASHIEHRLCTAYHPQANGKVERSVKTILVTIKKLLRGCDQDWDLYVLQTQLWVNLHISETHKSSPFSLMFCRPFAGFTDHRGATWHEMSEEDRRSRVEELYNIVYPAVRERKDEEHEKRRQKLNSKRPQVSSPFPDGALVMLKDVRRSRKTEPSYKGPFIIARCNRGGAYVLKCPDGTLYPRDVPPNHLKLIESSPSEDDGEDHYEVEAIVSHRGEGQDRQYLVKWRDYDSSENTWEPASNFDDEEPIRKYFSRLNGPGGG